MPYNGRKTLQVRLAAYGGKPNSMLGCYNLLIETSHLMSSGV